MKDIFSILLLGILINHYINFAQDKTSAQITSYLSLDDSWSSTIYLSHIPTFDDMYVMSNEMIIARTGIDSLGYFEFNIDFLPEGENLYWLHLVKKEIHLRR